jgi:hypothetical protein
MQEEIFFYLALEDIDFAILDLDMITKLVELISKPVLLLSSLQRNLGLLLDNLILLFHALPELLGLEKALEYFSGRDKPSMQDEWLGEKTCQ